MRTTPERKQPSRTTSPVLDRIASNKANYWVGFFSDPAAAIFLLLWDLAVLHTNIYFLASSYISGLISWTLFEYCFHRWIYHRGDTLAHAGHRLHHESPKALIGMPWFLTTGFLLVVWFLFGSYLQVPYILSFLAGLTTGFFFYGVFHHVHHHFEFAKGWNRKLRVHHKIHHAFPEVNFGVTTRVWDYVFGTTYDRSRHKLRISNLRQQS